MRYYSRCSLFTGGFVVSHWQSFGGSRQLPDLTHNQKHLFYKLFVGARCLKAESNSPKSCIARSRLLMLSASPDLNSKWCGQGLTLEITIKTMSSSFLAKSFSGSIFKGLELQAIIPANQVRGCQSINYYLTENLSPIDLSQQYTAALISLSWLQRPVTQFFGFFLLALSSFTFYGCVFISPQPAQQATLSNRGGTSPPQASVPLFENSGKDLAL